MLLQPLLFFRPLFVETFYFRDLYLLFLTQRRLVADQLRQGLLPLWDPLHHGGQALLANLNNTALYPTNVLYIALPPVPALNLEIVGHFAFAALAAYLCARALRLAPCAAFVAGLVFELCGVALSCANLVNRLYALPWLPLLVFALVRHSEAPRRRWFALAVVAGTLQVLAGFPELVLVTWATAAVVTLLPNDGGPRAARARTVLGTGGLSLGLSAIQLLPLVSLVALSSRGGGTSRSWATWSVDPGRLPELLFPGFLGRVTTLSDESYWGRFIEDQGFPYLLSISFGTTCAGLVLASIMGLGSGPLTRRTRLGLAALAAAGIVASLGRHLPGFDPVGTIGIPLVRYPVKLLLATVLPAALLAGDGLERLASAQSGRGRGALAIASLLGPLGFLAGATVAPGSFHRAFFRASPTEFSLHGVHEVLLEALLVAAAFAAVVTIPVPTRVRRIALAALLLMDLAYSARRVNSWAPRALLTTEPPIARTVRASLGEGKLYRHDPRGTSRVLAPSDDVVWLARTTLGSVGKYTAANFGIPVVFHDDYDQLALREIVSLGDAVGHLPWNRRVPALSAAGVTTVLTADSRATAVLPLTVQGIVPNGGTLYQLRNPKALPGAGFVVEAWSAENDEGQFRLLLEGRGGRLPEPQETVVLTGIERPPPADPCPSVVRRLETAPAFARYEVESGCGGFLVFTTPFDPGWSARIDGRAVPILRANFAFQALPVGPGRHEVRHSYRPEGLAQGLAISVLTVLLVGLALRRSGSSA